MSTLSEDLAEEFADKADLIHALKVKDHHFARLIEKNHVLWKEIQQIQKGIHPADDEALETLEKQRLLVLDEIGAMLRAAEAS
jgi:uncharacterized protein